jgi:hypothetical protein
MGECSELEAFDPMVKLCKRGDARAMDDLIIRCIPFFFRPKIFLCADSHRLC